MDHNDEKMQRQRLNNWDELQKREDNLNAVIGVLQNQISGNASEVLVVSSFYMNRRVEKGDTRERQLVLDPPCLTDYEVAQALLPLMREKLSRVAELKKEV